MGCERTPFILVALSSALLVLEGTPWAKVFGVVYFLVLVGIMAFVNSNDPFAFQIYMRYWTYQDFYPNNAIYPGKVNKPKNFKDNHKYV
jgi:type IV secretory pathway TrbD component